MREGNESIHRHANTEVYVRGERKPGRISFKYTCSGTLQEDGRNSLWMLIMAKPTAEDKKGRKKPQLPSFWGLFDHLFLLYLAADGQVLEEIW